MQTDLEEAKAQEVSKLQNQLQALQSKVDESNALLIKEREAAKKAIEEAPPVIQETQVLVEDTEKIEALKSEVENLKVWLEIRPFYMSFLRAQVTENQVWNFPCPCICILLQATLDSEKQRADEANQKYAEAQETSEERRKKLEETEKKVHQFQDTLRGQYIHSIIFLFVLEERI